MSKTFEQTVEFDASPEVLYDIYMDSDKHSAAVNAPAVISREVGGRFSIFGGGLTGTNLQLVPGKMTVQAWRGGPWQESDLDSVLILQFSGTACKGRIHLVHANVPDKAYEEVNERAWDDHYWKPWKAYLEGRSSKKAVAAR